MRAVFLNNENRFFHQNLRTTKIAVDRKANISDWTVLPYA